MSEAATAECTVDVAVAERKFVIGILDHTGHDRLVWSQHIPEQMKEAQKKFYELLDKGFAIFAVLDNGQKSSRRLSRFEPNVEEVIAVAPLAGG